MKLKLDTNSPDKAQLFLYDDAGTPVDVKFIPYCSNFQDLVQEATEVLKINFIRGKYEAS